MNTHSVANTKRVYRDLHDYASAHGIPASALAQSGWQYTRYQNRPALRFRTQTGTRYRFLDGQKPTYINPRGYKRCWYLLDEAVRNARTHGRALILCNGEASTVSAQAYGLPATAITGGEKQRLPDDLLAQLLRVYPPAASHRILVALDCDDAGRAAAAGITAQLTGAGYPVEAVDLSLSDGGDLADFCMLNADGAPLMAVLESLPRLADYLPEKPNTARIDLPRFSLNSRASQWEQVREEVMRRLDVGHLKTNSDGWTIKRIPNPFVNHEHDHRAPACVFNVDSGTLYDHKGGHTYTLRELADLLNVEYPNTIKEGVFDTSVLSLSTAPQTSPLIDSAFTIFAGGVPDAWRAAVAAYLPKPCVVLLEKLNAAFRDGQLDPARVSLPEVKAINAGWKLTRSTLERGFEGLVGVFFTELDPVNSTLVSQSVEKPAGGRPRLYYRLLPYHEVRVNLLGYAAPRIIEKYHPVDGDEAVLARLTDLMLSALGVEISTETLNATLERAYQAQSERGSQAQKRAWREYKALVVALSDHRSTALPADVTFTNRADYDALLTRAIAENDPQRSRKQIAQSIGVSVQQVSTVLKRAGIQNDPQFEEFRVDAGGDTRAQIHKEALNRKGWVREIVIKADDGVQHYAYDPARTPALIDGAMLAGAEVAVRVQIASKQRIVRESPLPVAKSVQKPRVEGVSSTKRAPQKSADKHRKVAKREPFTGKSFDPQWVRGQVWLALRLLGWCDYGEEALHNPHTGEIITKSGSDAQLVQALIGQRVALTDDLLNFARDELGAIV